MKDIHTGKPAAHAFTRANRRARVHVGEIHVMSRANRRVMSSPAGIRAGRHAGKHVMKHTGRPAVHVSSVHAGRHVHTRASGHVIRVRRHVIRVRRATSQHVQIHAGRHVIRAKGANLPLFFFFFKNVNYFQ